MLILESSLNIDIIPHVMVHSYSAVESFLNSVLMSWYIVECGFWCGIIPQCCSSLQVAGFWHAYCSLPVEQQEWDASQKLRSEISQYRELLPLLKKLHSKVSK